jgi:hypothetical protein
VARRQRPVCLSIEKPYKRIFRSGFSHSGKRTAKVLTHVELLAGGAIGKTALISNMFFRFFEAGPWMYPYSIGLFALGAEDEAISMG